MEPPHLVKVCCTYIAMQHALVYRDAQKLTVVL